MHHPRIFGVSAPGRICLFGEHQDYLGLPVVAAAVDLRIGVEAAPREDGLLIIEMPDTGETAEIDPAAEQVYTHHRDYLRSSVNVLRRAGARWSRGYSAVMRSTIPINAGVSSSSAMTVMWLRFLLQIADNPPAFAPEDLARWGYEAEVAEFGDPGGMMDHYCAALGGLLSIDTRSPFDAEQIGVALDGFVIGHSREPKATLETLAQTRREVTDGLARMKEVLPSFDLACTPLAEVEGLFKYLQSASAKRLRANLVNRNITIEARRALMDRDEVKIGHLLTLHHAQLRDGLGLSTPKIERMLEASRAAGALGGKINGSGGGGTMFAYAPGRQRTVAEAIEREGGIPYVVRIGEGARID
jgi:galactokinase